MYYYVIENQIKEDGTINNIVTGRSSFALGLSYYYERKSKMVVTNIYPHIALMLVDENLNVIERDDFDTLFEQQQQ